VAAYPVALVYEMVAEVVEAAPDVTEVQVGDLVHTGTPHQEETVLDVAASLAATYPLVRLPTGERLERALFVSLATVALQAVHDAEIKLGDAVSVHGLGAIGLLAVQMCRLEGIQTFFGSTRTRGGASWRCASGQPTCSTRPPTRRWVCRSVRAT